MDDKIAVIFCLTFIACLSMWLLSESAIASNVVSALAGIAVGKVLK